MPLDFIVSMKSWTCSSLDNVNMLRIGEINLWRQKSPVPIPGWSWLIKSRDRRYCEPSQFSDDQGKAHIPLRCARILTVMLTVSGTCRRETLIMLTICRCLGRQNTSAILRVECHLYTILLRPFSFSPYRWRVPPSSSSSYLQSKSVLGS